MLLIMRILIFSLRDRPSQKFEVYPVTGVSYNKAVTAIVVTAFFLYRAGDALSYKNIIQVLSFQFSQAEFIVKIFRKGNRYGIGI